MRGRLRILFVVATVFAMVLVLNVSAAFAHHAGDPVDWMCDSDDGNIIGECTQTSSLGTAAQNALGPVFNSPAGPNARGNFVGIDKNPLCLLHNLRDLG